MLNHLLSTCLKKGLPVILFLLLMGIIMPHSIQAQTLVVQTESFESNIFPAPGWKTAKGNTNPAIGGNGSVQRQAPPGIPAFPVNVGSCPGGGANVMAYNSGTALANDTTYVITKPYDFSNNSGVNPTLRFYMYRDGFNATSFDRIEVLINTTPNVAGATLLTNTFATTAINRNNTLPPAASANSWNQYTYSLNAATYTGKKYYFFIRCIRGGAGVGLDMFYDLFVTNTHPSIMNGADVSMDLIQQNIAAVGTGQTNSWVVGVRCVVGGNSGCGNLNASMLIPPQKLDSLLFNSNGTTNVNDIQNAKIWYTGGSNLFSTGYITPFPSVGLPAGTSYPRSNFGATIPVVATNMDFISPAAGPCFYLEYDTTYFWLTYDVKPTAINGNYIDADFRSANVGGSGCPVATAGTGTSIIPSVFSINGATQIDFPYCVPTFISGTSQNGFTNNDYIHSTFLIGAYGSLINTGVQTVALQNPAAPGYPNCHFVGYTPYYELMQNVPGRSVILLQGGTYSITIGCGSWYTNNVVTAWIDYDRSGTFDPSEKLGEIALSALGTTTFSFTTPAAGYVGPTRMRVREVFAQSNIQPCATYTYGETEDYIINISPNCNPAYKLWLGNTDNWNEVSNWCGGVPSINDDVVIDKGLINPGYTYYNPTIKSGVGANCKNISIAAGDTLIVNAPIPGALKIKGNLTNNGGFKIVNAASPEITFSSGTLVNNTITPFKSQSTDARTQIIYTAAELSAQGIVSGDRIKALKFNITTKGSTAAFNGFTISYGLTATSAYATATALPTSTVVYGPTALNTTLGSFTIQLATPIIWDGVNNLVIQYCFDNASSIGATDDRLLITQTTGRNSTLVLSTTTNAASGCGLTYPFGGVSSNFFPSLATSRPNTTFIIDRPYYKYFFNVQGQWTNNNYFEAGNSRVIMDSVVAQTIGGSQVSTFHELEIAKTVAANTVTLGKSIVVNDTLVLTSGQLFMNQKSIDITNATSLKAIDRMAGALICEDNSSTSKVNWNFGSLIGLHEIPFATASYATNTTTQYIPVRITNVNNVNLGIVSVNTYNTIPANTPWPPTVSQLTTAASASAPGVPGANNAAFTVDRFWYISKSSNAAAPSTTLQLFFADAERPAGAPMNPANQPKAQPWISSSQSWLSPAATGTFAASPSTNSSTVANYNWVNGNSLPWAIALGLQPLGVGISLPAITVNGITPESCPGASDGAINISVSGGSAPYSYLWSNGAITPNISGLINGPYTIIVTDSNGSTATVTVNVPLFSQQPGTLGPVSGPTTICAGSSQVYTVPALSGATNYQWTVPPGAIVVSGQGTTQVILSTAPNFVSGSLCVTASNGCGSTAPSCLLINASVGLPATPTSISGSGFGVCGLTRTYSVTAVAGVTFNWSLPAGANLLSGQGTNSISVQFTNSFSTGTISVIGNNACGNSNIRSKTIYGRPAKPTVITGPAVFCLKDTTVFTTPVIFGTTTYTWTVPAGLTILSGQGTTLIKVKGINNNLVNGDICVKTGNTCGTTGTYCITVQAKPIPNVIAGITGSGNGVCGMTLNYSVPVQNGITFTWSIPPGVTINSGQGTRIINVTFSGSYTTGVISVVANSNCGNPVTVSKTINGKPIIPNSITGPSSLCSNAQNVTYSCNIVSGATTYTWTVPVNTSIVSGQGTNTIVMNFNTIPGTVQLKVKSSNGCGISGNFLGNLVLNSCPRIGDTPISTFELYPNPASENVTIHWYNAEEEKVLINCLNVLGQSVLPTIIRSGAGDQQEQLTVSSLANGVYFIQLQSPDGEITSKKLVISR